MVFSSFSFLSVFLPVTAALYYLVPVLAEGLRVLTRSVTGSREPSGIQQIQQNEALQGHGLSRGCHLFQNLLLIAASLLFYACGEAERTALLVLCALWNYVMARCISPISEPFHRKMLLFLALGGDLSLLIYYKYTGFFLSAWNSLSGASLFIPSIALPIGISFYTFQAMSYVLDVYRDRIPAERGFDRILLYLSFFPQLIAGPVVRYRDISSEIAFPRRIRPSDLSEGLCRFILGLSKKVLIADAAGRIADQVFAAAPESLSMPLSWLGAAAFTVQIYYDFSGYSDMALGLGRIFGFHLPENFRSPLTSASMLDFWKRWHITLTDWFREYVYIPLGGNRKGRVRSILNRMIVFSLAGFWHGAGWNFILWGLCHGILTAGEVLWKEGRKSRKKDQGHICTLILVTASFVLFRAETPGKAGAILLSMLVPAGMNLTRHAALGAVTDPAALTALAAGILFAVFPWREKLELLFTDPGKAGTARGAAFALSIPALLLCMASLAAGAYHPFIYFRF